MALLVDDVVQLVGDLAVHAAEVEAVQPLLAFVAQLLQQLAKALHLVAVAVAHALLHEATEGGVDVAVVQEVVGEVVEQGVGIEIEPFLGAVPARVGEPTGHGRTLSPPGTDVATVNAL